MHLSEQQIKSIAFAFKDEIISTEEQSILFLMILNIGFEEREKKMDITLADLKIDPSSIGKELLLVDVKPSYSYSAEGKKTEQIQGHVYMVACKEHKLRTLPVKIEGKKLLDADEGFCNVEFDGLEIKSYSKDGKSRISAKAKGISVKGKNQEKEIKG